MNHDEPLPFQPLPAYVFPSLPTEERVRLGSAKFLALFRNTEAKPFVAYDRLRSMTRAVLDRAAPPPAYGPVIEELQATLQPWIDDPSPTSHLAPIVLPPCEEHGILEEWARTGGHQIVPEPSRRSLVTPTSDPVLPDLDGTGVLVVPRLERWFLRHQDCLKTLRALLGAIDGLGRKVVVGCNSWAWEYLIKAARIELLLPTALTFAPFDASRLHAWLSGLTRAEIASRYRFRLPQSGKDVTKTDENGARDTDFFETLAARSLGIPWVAWPMWRSVLRREGDADHEPKEAANQQAAEDEQTLWIAALEEFVLPGGGERTGLFTLHALLVHGTLTTEELRLVLPMTGESNIVSALLTAGLVKREDDRLRCPPRAYPAIRDGLSSAGFPTGRI